MPVRRRESAEFFAADDPPARLQKRLRELGRCRKRYSGARRSPYAVWAVVLPAALGVLGLAGWAFTGLVPGLPAPSRMGLTVTSAGTLAVAPILAGSLAALHRRHRVKSRAVFEFREHGGHYRDDRRGCLFTWAAVGQVVFAPDDSPGRTSELILSMGPQRLWQSAKGWNGSILRLPDSLVITSEFFPLHELHQMAGHLRATLGTQRVTVHARDGKLYRLD